MHERSEFGARGETLAARWLESRGWRIVERNVRYREGELDIVATRGGILAFVEVKSRRSARYGSPREAVTRRKQATIRGLASRYLAERKPGVAAVRFDVIEVQRAGDHFRIEHVEGCF